MGRPPASLTFSILLVCVALVSQVGPLQLSQAGIAQVGPRVDDARDVHAVDGWDGSVSSAAQTTTDGRVPPITPDSVILDVEVFENGTAAWRIEYRTRLDDPATEAAFQSFQRDLRNRSTDGTVAFYGRIRESIESAENATGREMNGSDFAVETSVRRLPQSYGVVVYSFEWQGFATVSSRQIEAGDALEGFFLDDEERLLLSWPRGYELAEVRPEPDTQRDRTVTWAGPTEFGTGEPRIRLSESPEFWSVVLLVGAAFLVVGVVAYVAWILRTGDQGVPEPASQLLGDRGSDSELLSNEEQVVQLLERRGGRVKQRDVADELGWTKTKTSYVVSNLREEGRIHSFRLGRENVLSLSEPHDRGQQHA